MGRITLHLRSGATITLTSDEIDKFSGGSSRGLQPALVIRSPTGAVEAYDLAGLDQVDIEERFRQAVMGLPRLG